MLTQLFESVERALEYPDDCEMLVLRGAKQAPEEIARLPRLRKLRFEAPRFDRFPESLWSLSNLKTLEVTAAKSIAEIDPRIAGLVGLKALTLSGMRLTTLPDSISTLPKLNELLLSGNKLNPPPECLRRMRGLRRLDLTHNGISDLPEWLGELDQLRDLALDGNRLRTAPAWLGKLSELRVLGLSGNRGLASVAPEVRALPELQYLRLYSTKLGE